MSGQSTYVPKTAFGRWFDQRLPLMRFANDTMLTFPTPRNLNFWYAFGAILTVMLGIQIVTGIVLAMHYIPSGDGAFDSVENIMRDVNYGWLLRYMHSNGASMFFFAVYIHMFRGLYYGSYKAPREVLWILGVLIFLLMIATAFLGYTLPWGRSGALLSSRTSSQPSTRFTKVWARALRHGSGAALASATRRSTASTASITCCRSSLLGSWGCISGRCMCRATTTRSVSM
jgi:hypothetical protein